MYGIMLFSLSEERNLMNFASDSQEASLTSTSGSFSRVEKIFERGFSAISFPEISARSAKFLARQSLTLHDLS